jgi:hypothetical protein
MRKTQRKTSLLRRGFRGFSIEIHFTTLYMVDLGTRAEPLSEGAQAGKATEEREEKS